MTKALDSFDLSAVQAIALDETASKRGQNYVTVFIDPQRRQHPALLGEAPIFDPVRTALKTLRENAERVVRRWTSTYTNARLEALNGLFQAARARARGYRNTNTFMAMIASPAGQVLKST